MIRKLQTDWLHRARPTTLDEQFRSVIFHTVDRELADRTFNVQRLAIATSDHLTKLTEWSVRVSRYNPTIIKMILRGELFA